MKNLESYYTDKQYLLLPWTVMKPIKHKYSPISDIIHPLTDVLGLLAPLFLIYQFVSLSITQNNPVTLPEIIRISLLSIGCGAAMIFSGNFTPTILSDDLGLHINFLGKRICVPWDEITAIKPLFNLPFLKKVRIIRTRSITPFHRLYGLLYSFSFSPSIIFAKTISDAVELENRVLTSLQKNSYKDVHPK